MMSEDSVIPKIQWFQVCDNPPPSKEDVIFLDPETGDEKIVCALPTLGHWVYKGWTIEMKPYHKWTKIPSIKKEKNLKKDGVFQHLKK